MYVFVYGSLKSGFSNHRLLENAKFICNTHTKECYTMLDLQSFPGVIKEKDTSQIQGEVYRLKNENIQDLDDFEGSWYYRENIELDNGYTAEIYFLKDYPSNPDYCNVIENGIWD